MRIPAIPEWHALILPWRTRECPGGITGSSWLLSWAGSSEESSLLQEKRRRNDEGVLVVAQKEGGLVKAWDTLIQAVPRQSTVDPVMIVRGLRTHCLLMESSPFCIVRWSYLPNRSQWHNFCASGVRYGITGTTHI